MIRTAIYAWTTGFGLVFGLALVAGPGSAASAPERPLRLADRAFGEIAPRARVSAALAGPLSEPRLSVAEVPITRPDPHPERPQSPLLERQSPEPRAAATPVTVQFDGVPPSQIVGDRVNLNLATAGNIASYIWTVMPAGTVGLKIYDSGAKADFTSRFPGTYVFLVAVAGADGSVAQAYHAIELRADASAQPSLPIPPAAPAAAEPALPAPQAMQQQQPQIDDPAALLKQWTAEVKSLQRRAERLRLASGFRQAAGAIDVGLFGGGDLFGQTKALCTMSLGGTLGPWESWFDKVEQLYSQFERLQVLGTPANYSAANKSVAKVLETFDDRQ